MSDFLTYTVTGIALASIYAISAGGLVLTYSTSGIFNFAHGAVGMFAAFVYWQMSAPSVDGGWGLPQLLSFVVVVFVLAPLFGWLIETIIMSRLTKSTEEVRVVVTVALLLFLFGSASVLWPQSRVRSLPRIFEGETVRIFDVNVPYSRIIILGIAGLVALSLRFILTKTRAGIAMRAVVDDRELLQLNGGLPTQTSALSWAIGSSLAALAGILVAMELELGILVLSLIIVKAFSAAVVGRLVSLPGAFAGAVILGLLESYVGGYLPTSAELWGFSLGALKFAVAPIMLAGVMMAQPHERLSVAGTKSSVAWNPPSMTNSIIAAVLFVGAVWACLDLVEVDTDLISVVPGFFFALVALSLVPLTGYGGQISLAQLSFAAVGAMAMGTWGTANSYGGIAIAILISMVVGAVVALPALRLSGIYLALATTAFVTFMFQVVLSQSKLLPSGSLSVPSWDLGFMNVDSNRKEIIVLAVLFALVGLALVALRHGTYGRRLTAMKDSPVACATLGLSLTSTKVSVFALSAGICGLAGSTMGRSISRPDFELTASMAVTTLAVVGGIGSVGGALIGGMMLGLVQSLVTRLFARSVVGIFGFFNIEVPSLMLVAPGVMGINISRSPSGISEQLTEGFRPISQNRAYSAAAVALCVALWLCAKADIISNWSFIAAVVMAVFAVVPTLPLLVSSPRRFIIAALGVVGIATSMIYDWEVAIESIGLRVTVIVLFATVINISMLVVGSEREDRDVALDMSPDLWGFGQSFSQSDISEMDRELGFGVGELSNNVAPSRYSTRGGST